MGHLRLRKLAKCVVLGEFNDSESLKAVGCFHGHFDLAVQTLSRRQRHRTHGFGLVHFAITKHARDFSMRAVLQLPVLMKTTEHAAQSLVGQQQETLQKAATQAMQLALNDQLLKRFRLDWLMAAAVGAATAAAVTLALIALRSQLT